MDEPRWFISMSSFHSYRPSWSTDHNTSLESAVQTPASPHKSSQRHLCKTHLTVSCGCTKTLIGSSWWVELVSLSLHSRLSLCWLPPTFLTPIPSGLWVHGTPPSPHILSTFSPVPFLQQILTSSILPLPLKVLDNQTEFICGPLRTWGWV